MEVDNEIELLIKKGSSITIEDLKKIKKDVLFSVKKSSIEDALSDVLYQLQEETYKYLQSDTINGLSATIYFTDLNDYYLNINAGKNLQGIGIGPNTLFDIASVTKLFTLILVFKYVDLGFIKLNNRICDLDSDFEYLDFKVEDIIKMAGSIITDKRIDEAKDKEDAIQRLKTVHPICYDFDTNYYTDIGFMVLSSLIEKIDQKPFLQVMKKFLNEYGVEINNSSNVAGNGHKDDLPHDPKARKMEGLVGSSGIFINSTNMAKFAKEMFFNDDLISRGNLEMLSRKLFEKNHSNKGYAGIYLKHELGIKKTSTPNEYSDCAFSHQGFTGSCAIFDPLNKIHNSILIDAIGENNSKKHPDFFKYYNDYHQKLVINTLKCYLIKQHYDKIERKDIVLVKKV